MDDADYKMFLYYLFVYLAPSSVIELAYPKLKNALKEGNFFSTIVLHSYVLMPNHFHFLLQQKKEDSTTRFMRRITNAYTRYFNEKYSRVGPLFQGVFKAAPIASDEYFLYLSRYIHRNPAIFPEYSENLQDYLWSSYRVYLGIQRSSYVQQDYILQSFSNTNSLLNYKNFVESNKEDNKIPEEYLFEE